LNVTAFLAGGSPMNNNKLSNELSHIPSGDVVLSLADKLPVMISLIGLDGCYQFVNKTFVEWLGIPREDIIGKSCSDVVSTSNIEDCGDHIAALKRVAETGEEKVNEMLVTHPSTGKQHCLSVKLVPHDSREFVYAFISDITESRQSQRAEAQYRAVVDTAGEGVIVMDSVGTISAFNRAAERLFRYDAAEVIGKNIKVLMPENYSVMHDGYLKRYVETRKASILGKGGVEAECQRKDGSVFPAELAVAEMIVNGEIHFTGIVRDITERKNYERDLRKWNENLEAEVNKRGRALDRIFNLSTDILAILRFDGTYESVSPSAETLTGVPVEKALGERIPYHTFAVPEDREKLIAVFKQVTKNSGAVNNFEFRVRHTSGSFRWTSWNILPVMEDEIILLIGRDITDERMREEALRQSQKMEAIGQLTGGIAHDFNNLLMGISGSLDLINRKLPEEEKTNISKYLDGAQGSAKRAAALTHRLLAFSRRQPLAPVVVDVNSLVEGMQSLIERTIGTEIEVISQLDEVWPTLCDSNQLESGLLNLILNARDAMPDGGTIVVKTQNYGPSDCRKHNTPVGEYVRITVQDCGTGMDEATVDKAFDPFFTTKPIGQGTGLGLSMLYGFVHQSGGHVKIESKPGNGTEVIILLPRTNETSVDTFEGSSGGGDRGEEGGRRILIVEDEAVIRGLLTDVLSSGGYSCTDVGDGNEALKILNDPSEQVDLMVSDVGLPGLNGKQLAEVARKTRPDLKILFITGYAAGITLRNDLLLDDTDMLLKPFTMDALQSKVSEMISQSS
jgi:PAS domain S-box-containing protein